MVGKGPKVPGETPENRRRSRADSIREALPKGPLSSIAKRGGRMVLNYVHILSWLPKYTREDVICDIIAGITIGLTMLPQSIAYALLAGLSPQYGLYSCFVGTFIYVFLGTVKEVSMGPTSIMALLTFEFTQDLSVDFVVLLTFLTGCVELLFGVLHLGVIIDFISEPVVSGFTTATSIVIAEAQMKGLLGLKYKSIGFLDNTWKLFTHLRETKTEDAILGISSIIFLLLFRKLKDIPVGSRNTSSRHSETTEDGIDSSENGRKIKAIKKFLWFLTIGRNALVVIICALVAYAQEKNSGVSPFTLCGKIPEGFPPLHPPPFSTTHNNATYTFGEMASELGSGILIVPVVSVLVNIAIAKVYSSGGILRASEEMLTLGICNIAGSFLSAMPTCGALTRSGVASASGVRTPLAGLYTGALIMTAIGFLTPYFYYIPRATLSAVLICAVIFLADFKIFKTLWKASKRDFFAALATLIVCLSLGIEIGLLVGVAMSCSFLLYVWARPNIQVDHKKVSGGQEYIMITPGVGLYFPAMGFVRSEVNRIVSSEGGGVLPVVLNCCHLKGFDYSAAEGMSQLLNEFKSRQQQIVLLQLRPNAMTLLKYSLSSDILHCSCEEDLELTLFGEPACMEDAHLLNKAKEWNGGDIA